MDRCFGFTQQLEGSNGAIFDCAGKRSGANDIENCGQGTVSRVRMGRMAVLGRNGMRRVRVRLMGMRFVRMRMRRVIFMRVARLCRRLVRCKNVHFCGGQAASAHLAHLKARAHAERGSRFLKKAERNAGIHQGAQQHVAAYAGKTLQISNTHGFQDFKP